MYSINIANAEMLYRIGVRLITAANLDAKVVKLTVSDLILEQQLLTTNTSYTFPVLTNNNGPANTLFNTEFRLNQQDSFISGEMGILLLHPSSATDATIIPHTYPSPAVFTGAGVAAALETIYNSTCKIVVNNDVVMPAYSPSRHRKVPFAQQVTAAANQNGIAQDSMDGATDGFAPLLPTITFIGSKNNVLTITLPAALAAIDAFDRVRWHFRGLLAQNSTIIT